MPKSPQTKMDDRCPRGLECLPDRYCPLAVQRLKALRHADKELTEEEENLLPGCKWAVQNQTANYCHFDLVANHLPSRPMSDMEIAHTCSISVEAVKKIEKTAIEKLRNSETFQEIIDMYDGDTIIDDKRDHNEWSLPVK